MVACDASSKLARRCGRQSCTRRWSTTGPSWSSPPARAVAATHAVMRRRDQRCGCVSADGVPLPQRQHVGAQVHDGRPTSFRHHSHFRRTRIRPKCSATNRPTARPPQPSAGATTPTLPQVIGYLQCASVTRTASTLEINWDDVATEAPGTAGHSARTHAHGASAEWQRGH